MKVSLIIVRGYYMLGFFWDINSPGFERHSQWTVNKCQLNVFVDIKHVANNLQFVDPGHDKLRDRMLDHSKSP